MPPGVAALVERIAATSREVVRLDAQAAARALFGDVPANLLVVGAAYQAGTLPLSAEAIKWAIELNGVAVAANTATFRVEPGSRRGSGRVLRRPGTPARPHPSYPVGRPRRAGWETRRLVQVRAADLVGYQGEGTARAYVADVVAAWRAERALGESGLQRGGRLQATPAHRMQDEYEVARLLTGPAFEAHLAAEVPGGKKMRYRLPPCCARARPAEEDRVGPVDAASAAAGLAKGKALRGTPLDLFGYRGPASGRGAA